MGKKLNYSIDPVTATVTVTRDLPEGGQATLVMEMNQTLNAVARRLALMGMTQVFQRAITRNKTDDPFDVIEGAYKDLQENGLAAFERKMPAQKASRGPTKAQRIAALAVMYSTTPDVIRGKLKEKTDEQVKSILEDPRVTDKANELKAAAEIEL